MKKILSALLALALLLGACCAAAEGAMTPGTYSATVPSMKGDMTVHVTVSETAITGIELETVDTVQMVEAVEANLIPAILESQSIGVDSVTGATVSSAAVKSGVRSGLEQAGADVSKFTQAAAQEKTAGENETADVVVVGSGAAGLSTAIQLKKNGVENVILLEKLGYFGGTSGSSSGGAWVVGGTAFNEMSGYDYDADGLIAHLYAAGCAPEGAINEALVRKIASVSAQVFEDYVAEGVPWDLTQYTFGDSLNEMPVAWVKTFYDTPWESGAGITMINALVESAQKHGVQLRLNAKVTGLTTDEQGAVTGVTVEGEETTYAIAAKKVVLATGGFQRNSELVAEIAPDYTGMIPFTGAGSTGDGIVMARELGAYVVGDSIGGARGLDMKLGYQGPLGLLVWLVGPVVNQEGVRFASEAVHYSLIPEQICAQTGATVYGITDSTNASLETLEQAVALGYVKKADTLEGLAEAMGLTDTAAFVSTIETYNADKAAGADDSVFGTPNASMVPVLEAPYYGVTIKAVSSFSLAGLAVDENCRIIREDGSAIENLYGAGELICGNLTPGYYPGSGTQVGAGLYEGKIIADDIAAAL